MSNRLARITQAEIERAIRAAKKAGVTEVEVKIGDEASIRIPLVPDKPVAKSEDIVL
jgi:2-iminoacetate synthase ThiH